MPPSSSGPVAKLIFQKRRSMGAERHEAIKAKVERLVEAGFIKETYFHTWVANVVLVRKPNGKWKMCVNYTDLNRACPKDAYPLPRIDQPVNMTPVHELLSFMDAYSGYNQIRMHLEDRQKIAFYATDGIYCYKVMPFGLKNAGATYQRLVNRLFLAQLGQTMEAYMDDMIVKSAKRLMHTLDLHAAFEVVRQHNLHLNPDKCDFKV